MTRDETMQKAVVSALRRVFDPEIPVNVHDLGLIYGLDVDADGGVRIRMTLTAPNCPMAETIVRDVERKVAAVDGVSEVTVELVWEPKWEASMMSAAAKLELEFTGHTGPAHVPGNKPARLSQLTIGSNARRRKPGGGPPRKGAR